MVDQADNSKYGGKLFDTDGVYCTRRYVPSAVVSTVDGKVITQGTLISGLSNIMQLIAEDITMEPIPPLTQSLPTNCTF
jgi:hypothetical protein